MYVISDIRNSTSRKRLKKFPCGQLVTRSTGKIPAAHTKEYQENANTATSNTLAHHMEQTKELELRYSGREKRGAYIRACFAKYYQDSMQFHAARAAMEKITKQKTLEQCVKAELKHRQKQKCKFKNSPIRG